MQALSDLAVGQALRQIAEEVGIGSVQAERFGTPASLGGQDARKEARAVAIHVQMEDSLAANDPLENPAELLRSRLQIENAAHACAGEHLQMPGRNTGRAAEEGHHRELRPLALQLATDLRRLQRLHGGI